MQLLNKISQYSLLTVGLALSLSASPVNAQAFKLGETNSPVGTAANFKGQTFRFNVGGDLLGTTAASVILNSIKFSITTAGDAGFIAYLYNITASGLPTIAQINAGTGSIATSTGSSIVPTDTEFTGGTLSSLRFAFSTGELSTANEYGVFINATSANNTVRGNTDITTYTGGIGYRDSGGTNLGVIGDSLFIVDATAVPFEFEASGGMAILGGLFLANKLRNRKQNQKTDDQA